MVLSAPCFILSAGRTGTHALSVAFRAAGFKAAHEPAPTMQAASARYLRGELSALALRPLFFSNPQRPYDVEANGHLSYLSELLFDWLPSARFVFIARDPVSWNYSHQRWRSVVSGEAKAHRLSWRDLPAPYSDAPEDGYSPGLAAWEYLAAKHVRLREEHPDRLLLIAYEDVFTMTGLTRIAGHFGARLDAVRALLAVSHRPNASPPSEVVPVEAWPLEAQTRAARLVWQYCDAFGASSRWAIPAVLTEKML